MPWIPVAVAVLSAVAAALEALNDKR